MSGAVDEATLQRCARCICDAQQHVNNLREIIARSDALLSDFPASVLGESRFLQEMQELITDTFEDFRCLDVASAIASQGAPPSDDDLPPAARLQRIEAALADARWTLLADVREQLNRKRDAVDAEIKRLNDAVNRFRETMAPLFDALDNARQVRAATVRDGMALEALEARVKQAKRAIDDRDLLGAAGEVDALDRQISNGTIWREEIRAKAATAQQIWKRADLLLLQSPLDARMRRQYETILRTASEPGVHGINLHDASTVVQQDREALVDRIERVTREMGVGGARELTPPRPPTASPVGTPSGAATLRDLGRFLYRLLIPEAVQRYLRDARCSLTITTNDLELPWELMHDDTEFLCLARPVARMPMGTFLPPDRPEGATRDKVRFLLIAPASDLPEAQREVETIAKTLSERWSSVAEVETLDANTATGAALNDRLLSGAYDVIHYAGHAFFDADNADLSGLVLKDGELFLAQKARRMLGGRPLVFLNACESGTARNEAERDGTPRAGYFQKPAGGLASSFIYVGALGCVGSVWPVNDDTAARFAIWFYEALLDGAMIGEALRIARSESRKAAPTQLTWATFVLYGDPTFQLRER